MKLLMTADCVGGVWTYAVELARGLADHDVEIQLVTAGGPLTDSQRAAIEELPHVRLVETRFRLEWMEDPWNDVTACGRRLLELAHAFRPDVVHLNDYSHAALRWPAPTVVVGHSCVYSWYEHVRGRAPGDEWRRYHTSVRSGLHAADVVVAPTRFMLEALRRHYGPLMGGRVVPNGLSSADSTDQPVEKERFVFAAGRWWDEAKNIAALVRVAPHVSWPIRLAGLPTPQASEFEFPAGVESLGRLNAVEMHAQYSRAAIYCLPARYEPFGLTPLEAASAGCALVLGDVPSLREVWGDAAAFVSPDDDRAIADTINCLMTDDSARAALAERGRGRAAGYSRSRMTDAYMRLYGELRRKRAKRRAEPVAGGQR